MIRPALAVVALLFGACSASTPDESSTTSDAVEDANAGGIDAADAAADIDTAAGDTGSVDASDASDADASEVAGSDVEPADADADMVVDDADGTVDAFDGALDASADADVEADVAADVAVVDASDAVADAGDALDAVADAEDTGVSDAMAPDTPDAAGLPGDATEADGADGADSSDAAAGPPTGCPPASMPLLAPAWPVVSSAAPKPPSTLCAKPGWPGTPTAAPLVLTEATASFGLPSLPPVDRCVLPHDFDGDGKTDLALVQIPAKAGEPRTLWWMRQQANGFDKTLLPLPSPLPVHGCVAADLDGDGDSDIAIVGDAGLWIVRNDAGKPVVQSVKLDLAFQQTVNAVAALDVDRDGDLDLVVAEAKASEDSKDWSKPCVCKQAATPPYTECKGGFCAPLSHYYRLLRNDGGFSFAAQGPLPDIVGDMWSLSVGDPDRDGWQDVFVGTEWGEHGWLHNGAGAGFKALTTAVGMLPWAHVMGTVVADLDLDGYDDLFIADYGVDTGYRLEPGKGWVNTSSGWKLWESWKTAVSWGVFGADLDSDGWLDLFVSNSGVMTDASFWTTVTEGGFVSVANPGHQLWHNQAGSFAAQSVPHPPGIPIMVHPTRLAVADLDDDGDLDVIDVPLGFQARILRNDTPQGGWLRVHLVGTASPRGGEGAWVEVWSGGHVQRRAWTHSHGHAANGTQHEHFGVGTATVDLVRVWWPSGAVSELPTPKLGALHTIVEPKGTP